MAEPEQTQPADPLPCAPCRGTGTVISNLGGRAQEVRCPWCDGDGVQRPGHDGQAARALAAGDG